MRLRDLGLDGGRRREPAQAPARHRPGLGEALDHHGLLAELRVALGEALETVRVDQTVVHVVADHVDARLGGDTRHGVERGGVEDAARGVAGRADDDRLGRRRHAGAKDRLVDLEAVGLRVEEDRMGMVGDDDALVQAERRRGDDDLVTRIEHGHEARVERLGRAVREDNLVGRIGEPRVTHVARDHLAHGELAVVGRIVGIVALERTDDLVLDGIGRVEIGFAERERDAAGMLGGERVDAADARGLERRER